MVVVLLACITFPGGGVYPWVWIPVGCATAALALLSSKHLAADQHARRIDIMLTVAAVAVLAQLVPLPGAVLGAITPRTAYLRQTLWMTPAADFSWMPISIIPGDTLAALGIFATAALMFRACRSVCAAGGTGRIVRAIAFIGLAASVAAIVQPAHSRELLYGIWRPLDTGARPFGAFVNRNHFATWIGMACPLVFGYLLARAPSPRSSPTLAQRIANALKELGSVRSWLIVSVCVMALALLISTSRSGLVALACAFGLTLLLGRQRLGATGHRWTVLQSGLLLLVTISFANFAALTDRFEETLRASGAGRGRTAIWADAWRLVSDFPLTGTGAGTFGTAIAVYQSAEPGYSIGNAHNHYLQLVAEGGALTALPAALVLVTSFNVFRRRLYRRYDPDFLVRAGAVAGICGVLVQSVWETGLRIPANAMLLAVLAAIATHAPAAEVAARAD